MIDDMLKTLARLKRIDPLTPASLESLAMCQKRMAEKGMPELPQDYIEFLKKCNGFTHGAHFYGTNKIPDPEQDFVLNDLVTANEEFIERNEDFLPDIVHYLLIGDGEGDVLFVYNIKDQRYGIIDKFGRDVIKDFDAFEALFAVEVETD